MSSVSDPFVSNADTWLNFSLCYTANEFDKADDQKKKAHFDSLVVLRCIAHVLPLLSKDVYVLRLSFGRDFHRTCNLDGWNDHIIQPARDAILDYYKVYTHNISSI